MGSGLTSIKSTCSLPFQPDRTRIQSESSSLNNYDPSQNYLDELEILFIIGGGRYSTVYHAKDHLTNTHVAVKKVQITKIFHDYEDEEKKRKSFDMIFTELAAYKRVGCHSSVVTLHSAFHYHTSCYFVMDCLSGGDLRHYLRTNGTLNEKCVVYIVGCIGSALHHIHSRGVVHRDVKPENIGLDCRGRPYLMDFGISVVSSEDNPLPLCTTSSGTLQYLAPEVLAPGHRHAYQVDYWSLGVSAFEILFGYQPFPRNCPVDCVKFVSNEYGWIWDYLSAHRPLLNPCEKINFESLRPPIDWIQPFPGLLLNLSTDGTAPQSAIISIPNVQYSSTFNSVMISDECQNLLKGLMDSRIPRRLGNISRYTEFSEHKCFVQYKYTFAEISKITSPMTIPTQLPQTPCTSSDTFIEKIEFPTISTYYRTKLTEFRYFNQNLRARDDSEQLSLIPIKPPVAVGDNTEGDHSAGFHTSLTA